MATNGPDVIDVANGGATNGADTINGMGGDDVISGGEGDDTIKGSDGNDSINGQGGADSVNGGSGDDFLKGGTGDDVMAGGLGNDRLVGGEGNDRLFGGEGDDFLFGGDGEDKIFGGTGNDRLTGGADADLFFFLASDGGSSADTITDFGDGVDHIALRGLTLADVISSAAGTKLVFNNGSSVFLKGVDANLLDASDFVLQDGSSLGTFF